MSFVSDAAFRMVNRAKAAVNHLFDVRPTASLMRGLFRWRYYSRSAARATHEKPMVVCMMDGRRLHGGLSDRLRNITTAFKYCQETGCEFRIHFVSPFPLEQYLEPAEYDWRLKMGELSFNSHDSIPQHVSSKGADLNRELFGTRILAMTRPPYSYKQVHLYCNFSTEKDVFGQMFSRLFKPAPFVRDELEKHIAILGGKERYVSVSTRFRELLGDFSEPYKSPHATPERQEQIIESCLEQIRLIRDRHPEAERVLVTSDSNRFLDACAALDFVYVIPGGIAHVDVPDQPGAGEHLKTFVDFFAIAGASKSYLLMTDQMFRSGFSMRAAQIYGHPFEVVSF